MTYNSSFFSKVVLLVAVAELNYSVDFHFQTPGYSEKLSVNWTVMKCLWCNMQGGWFTQQGMCVFVKGCITSVMVNPQPSLPNLWPKCPSWVKLTRRPSTLHFFFQSKNFFFFLLINFFSNYLCRFCYNLWKFLFYFP